MIQNKNWKLVFLGITAVIVFGSLAYFSILESPSGSDTTTIGFRKIRDDPGFEATIDSLSRGDDSLIVKFHHDSVGKQPVKVEGYVDYSLSTGLLTGLEDAVLKVGLVEGEIPYFRLHIGEDSEIFEFGVRILNI